MDDKTKLSPTRAGVSMFLLTGIWACIPEDAEPIDELHAVNTDTNTLEEPGGTPSTNNDNSSSPESSSGSSNNLRADFNGDGYADLAIGVPEEYIGGVRAGAVNVLYGSADGLTAADDQFWHQDRAGIRSDAETDDRFGDALAAGDFDGDGYADLAIGAPGDSDEAGVVNVLYGSADGLKAAGNQLWHQGRSGIRGDASPGDGFGSALTSGDFDGDGYQDLAVGVPFDSGNRGAVNVIYGSSDGLTTAGDQRWHQNVSGVNGIAEPFDMFGAALAAGDFDNDGRDDLAIGVPWEDLGDLDNAGSVNVLYGSDSGLSANDDQDWNQDSDGIDGIAEASDWFGDALTVGDFDGDGFADLVIGVPHEDVGSKTEAGAINVIYGSDEGLAEDDDQFLHQNSSGIDGIAEPFDVFGRALAAGDFDEDGRDDLAIGVPGENLGDINNGGLVNVIYGSGSGLSGKGDQIWHQNTHDVSGVAESGDEFGSSVSVGDFDGDGAVDLVVGVPLEDVGSIVNAGAVNVLYGGGSGLTGSGDQVWHQDRPGVEGRAEANDQFGAAVR
jgi:hypothetical protein